MWGGGEDLEFSGIVQRAEVRGQPPSVRRDFVYKVFFVVVLQMLATFAVASPLVFRVISVFRFFYASCHCAGQVFTFAFILAMVMQFVHFGYAIGFWQTGRRRYMWLLNSSPWNFLWLLLYSVLTGVVLGFASVEVTGHMLIILGVALVGLIVVLSAYAMWTSRDWSVLQIGQVASILLLLNIGCGIFHVGGDTFHRVLCGCWAVLFQFLMIQQTQLIFGTARPKVQAIEYTIDMYAFAAFHLYHTYVNTFFFMLHIFHR